MKRYVQLLLAAGILLLFSGYVPEAPAQIRENPPSEAVPQYAPDELLVKFRPGVPTRSRRDLYARHGAVERSADDRLGFRRVKLPRGRKVSEWVARFRSDASVEYAEPNFIAYTTFVPDDYFYDLQWHFDNPVYGGVNAEAAWDMILPSGAAGAVVAVIDTGVAYEDYGSYVQAPDLAGTTFVSGWDFVNNDSHPNDDEGHGTHVTGTIAQTTNNGGLGTAGLAFGASIMPVKVLNSGGSGYYSDIASGIRWAADNGADVINMSLGGGSSSTTLRNALIYARNAGVTIACAAGNGSRGSLDYPGAYDECIAVGATDYREQRAPYSNWGTGLDIVAPGGDTSVDRNGDGYVDGVLQQTFSSPNYGDFSYWFYQGTSMATPHVAAAAAVLIANGVAFTPDEVQQVLQESAEDLGPSGWDSTYGWGLLDLYAALNLGQTTARPTAQFSASPTTGEIPFEVSFTDQSSPDVVEWSWDFGDLAASGDRNPSHIYTTPGIYTVSLTVTGPGGVDTETKTDLVEAYETSASPPPPTAGFSASPTDGEVPLTVSFTDGSLGEITGWTWDFGDGGGSTSPSPNHTYADPGTYTVSLTVAGAGGPDSSEVKTNYITVTVPPPPPTIKMERGIVPGVGSSWVVVDLLNDYDSMVVVGTPNYDNSDDPGVVRIRNAAGSSFEVRVDPAGGSNPSGVDVHYLVVEEGVYGTAEYGVKMEAVTYTSTVTDHNSSWSGESRSYANSYASPVVLGQVMTYNDSDFSTFWSRGSSRSSPPSSSTLYTGKNVGEDGDTSRAAETVGYVVIESGTWSAGGMNFIAGLGGDSVKGVNDSPPYSYSFGGLSTAAVAVASQAAMDGSNGGWAILYGSTPLTSSSLRLAIDEDQAGDSERAHTSEQVAYIIFDNTVAPPEPTADFSGNPTTGLAPLTVSFSDESTGGAATGWFWDFGDGTSSLQNPSHTYGTAGTYTVTLTVTNGAGSDSLTRRDYITVAPPPDPPVAAFSGSPLTGVAPLEVAFSDGSTTGGAAESWAWTFGDSGTSSLRNPRYTYSTPGTYEVILTVTNSTASDTETKPAYVTVNEPAPAADFSGGPRSGIYPLTVSFTDQSGGGTPTSWLWDFGNGTSTLQNPSRTYTSPGTYTVSLTATNDTGSSTETKAAYISVSDPPPVASFTGTPTSGYGSLTVTFTDTSTNPLTGWSWTFGDGGTSSERNPSHTYALPGTYTVALTASGPGGSDTRTRNGYIAVMAPPAASFSGSPVSGYAPLAVNFADASTGTITSRSWTFGDGNSSTAQSPSHTYAAAGTYTVILTVTGPGGTDTVTRTNYITASPLPPAPAPGFTESAPTTGVKPLTVTFIDASTGTITSRSWDFGDGGTSTAQNPSHTYTAAGTYSVALTVAGPGGSNSLTKWNLVTVDEPAPVASFTGDPRSGDLPLEVSFTDTSSGPLTGWSWDFGDGGTSTLQNPSHTYAAPGTYTVSLAVAGPGGDDTLTAVDYVTVADPPVVKIERGVLSGLGPSWVTVDLANTYDSMVVVATPNYSSSTPPGAVRIRNAAGSSFEVRVDPAGGSNPSGVSVHYLVVEEGVYSEAEHGVKMEAVKYLSTVTANKSSWSYESRSYLNSYSDPVVLGQVMTYNDPDFSVFWCRGSSLEGPPTSSTLRLGKHVGEDGDKSRSNETIGYVVIEAGSWSAGGLNFVADLGNDSVKGVSDSPPYSYSFSGLSSPAVAVASQGGMDGSNGGWAILYGSTPLTSSSLLLAIDEDQANDSERKHVDEYVGYVVFE